MSDRAENGGRLVPVSDTAAQPDESTPDTMDLETLVGEWLTVPDAAERLGVPLSRVRQMVADREVIATRIGERKVTAIPAKFVDENGPRPELRGTFTVLADGGMDDAEIIEWLFTPDPTLPVEGAPIDALRAGHKTEVRRRAQELAF
ncbi:Rv2175c family DNA-binding protein [Terrabacter terrigena]